MVFETFYGKLKTAPMIRECPFNMECKVIQTVKLPMNQLFIGEIVAALLKNNTSLMVYWMLRRLIPSCSPCTMITLVIATTTGKLESILAEVGALERNYERRRNRKRYFK